MLACIFIFYASTSEFYRQHYHLQAASSSPPPIPQLASSSATLEHAVASSPTPNTTGHVGKVHHQEISWNYGELICVVILPVMLVTLIIFIVWWAIKPCKCLTRNKTANVDDNVKPTQHRNSHVYLSVNLEEATPLTGPAPGPPSSPSNNGMDEPGQSHFIEERSEPLACQPAKTSFISSNSYLTSQSEEPSMVTQSTSINIMDTPDSINSENSHMHYVHYSRNYVPSPVSEHRYVAQTGPPSNNAGSMTFFGNTNVSHNSNGHTVV